ncbi:MAG: Holliday junction resolvase RuvX [Bacilli bacterium]|nr:Holliday junction resolvase RuvX [Bacilli bacterium]MDD4547202.1 Holliday junction resolvase RuvX [Bacilli bacterium]
MRYLGLDLGTRTLGIAISDLTATIANSIMTLRFAEEEYDSLLPKLKEIVDEEKIDKIILGLPKNMNNTIGSRAEVTIMFKEKLEKYMDIEVILQDERRSTIEANNYMLEANLSRKKRKKHIDGLAASIILQTYLDKMKGR